MTPGQSVGLKTILARHSITSFLFVDGAGNKTLTLQRFSISMLSFMASEAISSFYVHMTGNIAPGMRVGSLQTLVVNSVLRPLPFTLHIPALKCIDKP